MDVEGVRGEGRGERGEGGVPEGGALAAVAGFAVGRAAAFDAFDDLALEEVAGEKCCFVGWVIKRRWEDLRYRLLCSRRQGYRGTICRCS